MSGSPNYDYLAHPTVVNPLAAIKSGLDASNAMNQNRQWQAGQLQGQAAQDAIDPATGQMDPVKYANNLKAYGPAAAYGAQASMQAGQTLQANQQKRSIEATTEVNKGIASLQALPDSQQNADTYNGLIDTLTRSGNISPQDAQAAKADMPPPGSDPQAFRLYGYRHLVHNMTPPEAVGATVGSSGTQTGPSSSTIGFTARPTFYGGQVSAQPQQGAPQGPSPDTDTQVVSVHVPGQPDQQMTIGQARVAFQQNPALAGLNPNVQTRLAPQSQPLLGGTGGGVTTDSKGNIVDNSGRIVVNADGSVPKQTTAAPQQAPPAAPAQPAPFQPTAARADAGAAVRPSTTPPAYGSQGPIGQSATLTEQATTGGKLAQQLEVQGQDASTKVQPLLAGMLTDLQGVGTTGFGSTLISRIRNFATNTGLAPPAVDWTNKQASSEALNKLFAQYEAQQLGSLGSSPSDSRQTLASAGSPSSLNTIEGNRQIIRNLQGNNDALDTMYRAWMASNTRATNPGDFAAWRSSFTAPITSGPLAGARFDPTTFAVNRMDPTEQHTYLTNLQKGSPADFAQFKKDWSLARQEGWVNALPIAQKPTQ